MAEPLSNWVTLEDELTNVPHRESVRLLITGDSMTTGDEGDFTWRYRIWSWLRKTPGQNVDMVGPYKGTKGHIEASPPRPPGVIEEPEDLDNKADVGGGYAEDTEKEWASQDFHFSEWGYQAAQAKDAIYEHVKTYQPDYLLVALGFNDMGWLVSDAAGTLQSIEALVDIARRAKSDLRGVLATVPHRTFLRDDLITYTDEYNREIRSLVKRMTTKRSEIMLAEFAEHYSCGRDHCPAGYDGLHPNALGEWQIAKAFSEPLQKFGLRAMSDPLEIPDPVHEPYLGTVTNLMAVGFPMGIKVTWDHLFGSRSYDVRFRNKTAGENWQESASLGSRYDTTFVTPDEEWEYQIRPSRGGDSALKGQWSMTVCATARLEVAPAPSGIHVVPIPEGVKLTWNAVEGWDVDRYETIFWDRDIPGAFPGGSCTRKTTIDLVGLNLGHTHNIWLATWATIEGEIAVGHKVGTAPVIPGAIIPKPPTGLKAVTGGENRVQLDWAGDDNAAAWLVYKRHLTNGDGDFDTDGEYVYETTFNIDKSWLPEDSMDIYVTAVNGHLESGPSETVRL